MRKVPALCCTVRELKRLLPALNEIANPLSRFHALRQRRNQCHAHAAGTWIDTVYIPRQVRTWHYGHVFLHKQIAAEGGIVTVYIRPQVETTVGGLHVEYRLEDRQHGVELFPIQVTVGLHVGFVLPG